MDGVATVPTVTENIQITAAQRYLVLVAALPTTTKNYGIISSMDPSMFNGDLIPADHNQNVYGYLIYDAAKPLPTPPALGSTAAIDDMTVLPFDQKALLDPVTQPIVTNFNFEFIEGISRGTVNGTTYLPPRTPTLYTAMSAPLGYVLDPAIYDPNSNAVVFNNTVGIANIVINNFDSGAHSFHIHGHAAQVIARGVKGTSSAQVYWDGVTAAPIPMRRDVFNVLPYSYVVIRFRTENPGIWLLNCHIKWHIEAGLAMTLVEDPIQIQQQNLQIPQGNYAACTTQGISTTGNAAGNSNNWLNFTGLNVNPFANPWGALAQTSAPFATLSSKRCWLSRFKFKW
ncbi:hypothetical protein G7Y89_g7966 [Cudoniella acicularis]|uniref:Plastocyanin-like domain-containing protein n=1 Tax=Cudoniella acicularis TaxID=354080 RepID=A0A8H4W117_9HELO|nr:hypothetical protein G7Y89_g7966 [Cudoniella acicularis]